MHILSPETDNCLSWISGRERMAVENISWSISTKECCRLRRGLNPRPPCLQSDGASNWATEAGCRLNRLSHTIYWKSPISILGTSWDLHIPREKWLNYLQKVETLIRSRTLRCLIWVCTVCQLPLQVSRLQWVKQESTFVNNFCLLSGTPGPFWKAVKDKIFFP